jgi:hypothetical protein
VFALQRALTIEMNQGPPSPSEQRAELSAALSKRLVRLSIAVVTVALSFIPWSAYTFGLKTSATQCEIPPVSESDRCDFLRAASDLYYPWTGLAVLALIVWALVRQRFIEWAALAVVVAFPIYAGVVWIRA